MPSRAPLNKALDFLEMAARPAPVVPLIALCGLALLASISSSLAVVRGVETSDEAGYIWVFGFSLFIAWWVELDRRRRGYGAPFEFSAFVFFAWPVLVPYYLYKTRGRRGVLWAGAVLVFFFAPYLIAFATYLALGGDL